MRADARRLMRRGVLEMLARGQRAGAVPTVTQLLFHRVLDKHLGRMTELVSWLSAEAQPVTYSELVGGGAERPRFAVSFDDGNAVDMVAARKLSELGVSACFFVIAETLDADEARNNAICRERLGIAPTPFMTRDDLDELKELGHEIGSHGMSHVDLRNADADTLQRETIGAAEILDRWLDRERHFAWPYGGADTIDRRALAAIEAAGFNSVAAGMRGSGASIVDGISIPIVWRESMNLNDSVAVNRRFVLRSAEQVPRSLVALNSSLAGGTS